MKESAARVSAVLCSLGLFAASFIGPDPLILAGTIWLGIICVALGSRKFQLFGTFAIGFTIVMVVSIFVFQKPNRSRPIKMEQLSATKTNHPSSITKP